MRITPLIVVTLIAAAAPLAAQQRVDRTVTLAAGPMSFDAGGTGTATLVGVSAAQTLP